MNKKNLFILFYLFLSTFCLGQSNFGVKYAYRMNNLSSDDLVVNSFNTHSFGLSYSMFVFNKLDFLIQLDYSIGKLDLDSYTNYYGKQESLTGSIAVNDLNLEGVLNYYLIYSDSSDFHFGLQGGAGTALVREWIYLPDETLFNGINNLKQYFIFGLTGGTEQFRVDLRYGYFFQNFLSGISVSSKSYSYNIPDSRSLIGSNSYFSINLTYYLTNLLYD